MKTTFITFLIIIFSYSSNAQINSVNSEDIKINNQITYQTNSSELKSILGNPTNSYSEYWEIEDLNVQKYVYTGAVFYLLNNKVKSFSLTNHSYYLQINNTQLKVGNYISSLQNVFPTSYNNKQNGTLGINIGSGDYTYLIIEYDMNNKITCIEQRFY